MTSLYPILKDVVLWLSVLLNLYIVYKLYQMRDVLSIVGKKENLSMFRQVKSMWGKKEVEQRWVKRDKSAAYKSGQIKFTEKMKAIVPLGLLDEFSPEEIQEYILNPEMIDFFIKARGLIGGGLESLQGLLGGVKLPSLPGRGRKNRPGSVPKMQRES